VWAHGVRGPEGAVDGWAGSSVELRRTVDEATEPLQPFAFLNCLGCLL
jgi:hypothetical protein